MNQLVETKLVIKLPENKQLSFAISLQIPPEEININGVRQWKTEGRFSGDVNQEFTGYGIIPFESLIGAKKEIKKILKKISKGGKIYFVDTIRMVGELYPVKINDIF